ncbi:MAG TPA: cutinase family protein [Candidatus Saccharimonadia bacterium]|nr:cutinase family protein [Candidatus Saccharimonadia bacterium]
MRLHHPRRPGRRPGPVATALAATAALVAATALALAAAPATSAGAAAAQPALAFVAYPPSSDHSAAPQAFLLPSGSTTPVQLTSDPSQRVEGVSLARDGSFAVVDLVSPTSNPLGDLYRVDVATKSLTRLTDRLGLESNPEIGPDQRTVTFHESQTTTPPGPGIDTLDLVTRSVTRVSPPDLDAISVPEGGASWSHDGTQLAYAVNLRAGPNAGGYAAIALNLATGIYTQHAVSTRALQSCAWTPDDGYLFCGGIAPGLLVINTRTEAFVSLSLDQSLTYADLRFANDWTLYGTVSSPGGEPHIRTMQVTNAGAGQITLGSPGGDFSPSLGDSGPVQPAPAGFDGSTPPTSTPPTTKPPGYRCGTVKFFGLRGSGEKNFEGEGMGATVDDVKVRMARAIPGLRFEAIGYPAVAIDLNNVVLTTAYVESEFDGREALLKVVRDFIAFCPTTYAVIAGYSQGAQAAGDAYELLSNSERKHIAGLILLGDPDFDPRDWRIDRGDYSDRLSGILVKFDQNAPRTIPRRWTPNVESYCTAGDPVCNYSKRNVSICTPITARLTCPHFQYVRRSWTADAARWASSNWRHLPPLR